MRFNQATVIAPTMLITFLYLPTVVCVLCQSIRFYGWRKWVTGVLDDPILFIFPILTSMSFYKKADNQDITSPAPVNHDHHNGNAAVQQESENDEGINISSFSLKVE